MATEPVITGAPARAPHTFTSEQACTLGALRSRLDHTAAVARLLVELSAERADWSEAVAGIAATLSEQAERLDALLEGC